VLEPPRPASSFHEEPIEWLDGWEGRLPKGMVIGCVGHPDLGKSLLSHLIAAEASKRGEIVIISNVDDDPDQLTRPRFRAAGADLDLVELYTPNSFPRLPQDFNGLRRLVEVDRRTLCILDPARLHWRVSFRNGHDLRAQVLDPLQSLAKQTGTSFLLVVHGLKTLKAKASPLDVVPGPYEGLAAGIPVIYLFGHDPCDSEQRCLVPLKFKVGEAPAAMTFAIDSDEWSTSSGKVISTGVLRRVDEERDVGWHAVAQASQQSTPPQASKLELCCEWLEGLLANAPRNSKQVKAEAVAHGHTLRTLRRAARELEVDYTDIAEDKGKDNTKLWTLPADHPGRRY
jgi:putative DNA primase/helicase